MLVLGVETSCDETGLAIFDSEQGLLAHQLHSQINTHIDFGGVVPELASRDHVRKIIPLLNEVLRQANVVRTDIDAVAYTAGPGLIGALLVGAAFARSLAWALAVPALGVHHMEAHLLAPMLEADKPGFPFLALLVSGGHTLLVDVKALGDYTILGQSLDDAAGEAFDKTAKLLGLPYPGGPALAKLAEQGQPGRLLFPRPMTDRPGLDFSFSGLKTAAVNTWQTLEHSKQNAADVAYAFEQAVVATMVIKCRRALQQSGRDCLVVAGGVGANRKLRQQLQAMAEQQGRRVYYPRYEFCTDNGAMVAYAGFCRLALGQADTSALRVQARWPIDQIDQIDQTDQLAGIQPVFPPG